jgi:hypothetical protein
MFENPNWYSPLTTDGMITAPPAARCDSTIRF